jgi:hypothetical protein
MNASQSMMDESMHRADTSIGDLSMNRSLDEKSSEQLL